jgi:hypothetical protein
MPAGQAGDGQQDAGSARQPAQLPGRIGQRGARYLSAVADTLRPYSVAGLPYVASRSPLM